MLLRPIAQAAKRFSGDGDCPFGSSESGVCAASLSSMVIGTSRRQEYCSGDDYDSCPIFLARMLRRKD